MYKNHAYAPTGWIFVLGLLLRWKPGSWFLENLLIRAICLNPAQGDPKTIGRLICLHVLREFGLFREKVYRPSYCQGGRNFAQK